MKMTSSKPYLIRAIYDWIVDNDMTPYLVVNAKLDGVSVPQQHVNKDGQIVLNVAPRAVSNLSLTNEDIRFSARFGGIPTDIYTPCFAVMGIYARENGQGMMFDPETPPDEPPAGPAPKGGGGSNTRPGLRVVK